MLINPGTQSEAAEMLYDIARSTGRRLGVELRPLDTAMIKEYPDVVYWMFQFDAFGNKIYRIQNRESRSRDIDIGDGGTIDCDEVSQQIEKAILDLNLGDVKLEIL